MCVSCFCIVYYFFAVFHFKNLFSFENICQLIIKVKLKFLHANKFYIVKKL